jgi:hypothetical protein
LISYYQSSGMDACLTGQSPAPPVLTTTTFTYGV